MLTLFDRQNAGRITQTPSGPVLHVEAGPADIEYRRYTRGYVTLAARRYYVVSTRRRYATLTAAVAALKTTEGKSMYEHVYQAVDKNTGEILAESIAPAPLEERFRGLDVYIRNDKTGVEWEIPE